MQREALQKAYARHLDHTDRFSLAPPDLILVERALGIHSHPRAKLFGLGQSGAIGGGAGTGAGIALYEYLGLTPHFDGLAGCSSGNEILFAATGNAVGAALAFTGAVNTPHFFKRSRYFMGGTMLNTPWLYHQEMARPDVPHFLDTTRLIEHLANDKGDICLVATNPHTAQPVVMNEFAGDSEVRHAMVVSAYLPGLIEGPFKAYTTAFRNQPLLDGAFSDPTAIRTAAARGATHAVVFSGHANGDRSAGKLSMVEQNILHTACCASGLTPFHSHHLLLTEFARKVHEARDQIETGQCDGVITTTCGPAANQRIDFMEICPHKLFRHMLATFANGAAHNFGLTIGKDIPFPHRWQTRLHEMNPEANTTTCHPSLLPGTEHELAA